MNDDKPKPTVAVERRTNAVLRSLIDAMLERVREAQRNTEVWSPEERRSAEHDLAAIMERVKQEATQTANATGSSGNTKKPTT
jgi:hypothetical protein